MALVRLLVTVLALTSSALLAQEETGDSIVVEHTFELPPLKVEADPVLNTGAGFFAEQEARVYPEQLADLNAQDLTGALRRVPGVTVSRYNTVGSFGGSDGGAFFIRGHGSGRPGGQVVTYTDGVPRFMGVWTHPLLDTISVDTANEIVIGKSPQPVFRGNGAFGVVEIFSKTQETSGASFAAEISYGTDETFTARVEGGYRSGAANVYSVAAHRSSDGHRPNADGETNALYGTVGYRFNDHWTASAKVHFNNGWAHDPLPVGQTLPLVPRYETESLLGILRVDHNYDRFSGEIIAYYDDGQGWWRQWFGGNPATPPQQLITDTTYDNYGLSWSERVTLTDSYRLLFGTDLHDYGGEVRDDYALLPTGVGPDGTFPETTFRLFEPWLAFFAEYEFSHETRLEASAGLRYASHREFDDEVGLQAGISLEHKRTTVGFSAARAYNFPGVYVAIFNERWRIAEDWRDLEAEVLEHVEVSFTHRLPLKEEVRLNAVLFHDWVSNRLEFSTPPPFPGDIRNIGEYEQTGAEVSLHAEPIEGLELFFGSAWLEPNRDDIPNTPNVTLSAGATYTWKGLRLAADAQRVNKQQVINPRFGAPQQTVGAYTLVNARASYTFAWDAVAWEVFAGMENIFDEDYELRPGYPLPGRTGYVGTGVNF